MGLNSVGDIIKNRREELKITQEELCLGICDRKTLSRIENGKNPPTSFVLNSILERLGLSTDMYYSLVFAENFAVANLQYEIISANSDRNFTKSSQLLEKLKTYNEAQSPIIKQFILRTEVLINSKILSPQQRIDKLTEAITITVPNFDINNFTNRFLSTEESKIILNIANAYSDNDDRKSAINILFQLLELLNRQILDAQEHSSTVILVTCNLSKFLCLEERYDEALIIAEKGINISIAYSKTKFLGEIMTNKAHCLCKKGNVLVGETLYRDAICIMRIMKHTKNAELTAKAIKEQFNIDVDI